MMVLLKLASCEEVGMAGVGGPVPRHHPDPFTVNEMDEATFWPAQATFQATDKLGAVSSSSPRRGVSSLTDSHRAATNSVESVRDGGQASERQLLGTTTYLSSFEYDWDNWTLTAGAEPGWRRHTGKTGSPWTGPHNASDGALAFQDLDS